ncbi:MAG: site-2 protease family protein [Elusimicrobia bacterium CG08_land_8_20_14_0_20_51_18]|nr:MAG: site-2 protease family protein [Elusimicrobia bacterium CG08_land_8_20_14_0_20_51_18]
MHGYIAYRKGDDTAYLSGRLTLNPVPHVDPVGTILLPLMSALAHMPMIGWAKPVPVNPYRMNDPRADMALVAASGPLSNFSLAFIGLVLLKVFLVSGLGGFGALAPVFYMLKFLVYINLALALFNLIPVYPLDGSQILLNTMPYEWVAVYERHIPYGFYIILILMVTGMLKYIIIYPMGWILYLFARVGLAV